MGLSERLRAFALSRPHLFIVQARDGTVARLRVERFARERGWPLALTPLDADVLVVCGAPGPHMTELVELLRRRMPFPREAVRLDGDAREAATELEAAAARLRDWQRQRGAAAEALENEAVPYGYGRSRDEAGGLPIAERSEDRDGIKWDALHVPFGPALPAWPAGLRLRTRLQGDVVQAAEPDIDAFVGAPRVAPSFWDEPFARALAGEEVPVVAAERRRAAAHLDSLARLLEVAGDPRRTQLARRLRDALLDGRPAEEAREGLRRLRRELDRIRLLDSFTDGIGAIDADAAIAQGVTGPALRAAGIEADVRVLSPSYPGFEPVVAVGAGDARSRWRQWLAEAEQALTIAAGGGAAPRGGAPAPSGAAMLAPIDGHVEAPRGRLAAEPGAEPPSAPLLRLLPDLVRGHVLSSARMIVATLDPDGDELAAARPGPAPRAPAEALG